MRSIVSRCGLILLGSEGQALAEYAIILMLVALVVFLMVGGIGGNVNNTYSTMNSAFAP